MQGSPFNVSSRPPLPRNYSEEFNAQDYENKNSIELESYARNLHNYLNQLLTQMPFPAFLFEKLEKRLLGITSILQSRSAASGALDREKASERLQALGKKLEAATAKNESAIPLPTSIVQFPDEQGLPPRKRARVEPMYLQQVRKDVQELKALKESTSNLGVEEEED